MVSDRIPPTRVTNRRGFRAPEFGYDYNIDIDYYNIIIICQIFRLTTESRVFIIRYLFANGQARVLYPKYQYKTYYLWFVILYISKLLPNAQILQLFDF